MALRLAEVVIPDSRADDLTALVEDHTVIASWSLDVEDDLVAHRILIASEDVEGLLDDLADRFDGDEGFRVVILEVGATLPRQEEPVEEQKSPEEADEESDDERPLRISREELYQDVIDAAGFTPVYLVTVGLSTVVAGAGLLRGDVAVIIGAMVIAPLLGPNVALSLAATLGDTELARHSAKTIAAGLAMALGLSILMGLLTTVDPFVPELYARSQVGISDVAIALAAGAAGSLAFTTGLPAAVVGVMVAVALLPPLVALGLFLSAGTLDLATGSAVLLLTNLSCLNLAAIATFLAQKVEPRSWWEAEKAKRATRIALGSWLVLVAILGGVIFLLR